MIWTRENQRVVRTAKPPHTQTLSSIFMMNSRIELAIARLESFRTFLSPQNKAKRELWVARTFLRNIELLSDDAEVIPNEIENHQVDVFFGACSFQVKEMQQPNRRRGTEVNARIEELKSAKDSADLIREFEPDDFSLSEILSKVSAEVARYSKYPLDIRRKTDLLIYFNYHLFFEPTEQDIVDTLILAQYEWRSVSVLIDNSTAFVASVTDLAPEALRLRLGRIFRR